MIIYDRINESHVDTETGEVIMPISKEHAGELNRTVQYNLDTIIHFGKHKGCRVDKVVTEDPTYIYWMLDKGFNMSREVRLRSNEHTKERMDAKGCIPVGKDKDGCIRFVREENYDNYMEAVGKARSMEVEIAPAPDNLSFTHEVKIRQLNEHFDNRMLEKHNIELEETLSNIPDIISLERSFY